MEQLTRKQFSKDKMQLLAGLWSLGSWEGRYLLLMFGLNRDMHVLIRALLIIFLFKGADDGEKNFDYG